MNKSAESSIIIDQRSYLIDFSKLNHYLEIGGRELPPNTETRLVMTGAIWSKMSRSEIPQESSCSPRNKRPRMGSQSLRPRASKPPDVLKIRHPSDADVYLADCLEGPCPNCHCEAHSIVRCPWLEEEERVNVFGMCDLCPWCFQQGHMTSDCPLPLIEDYGVKKEPKKANYSGKTCLEAPCTRCFDIYHSLPFCDQISSMERFKVVEAYGLCLYCFSPWHDVTECQKEGLCYLCNHSDLDQVSDKRHHFLICAQVEKPGDVLSAAVSQNFN